MLFSYFYCGRTFPASNILVRSCFELLLAPFVGMPFCTLDRLFVFLLDFKNDCFSLSFEHADELVFAAERFVVWLWHSLSMVFPIHLN